MTDLKGKTLFITGASRGIGKAIALRAAKDGASIAIAAKTTRPHPKLPGTIFTAAEEIEAAGGKALPCVVDVRFEDQVEAAVAKTVETFGKIDILVNNASAILSDRHGLDPDEALRPDAPGQYARHVPLFAKVHPAPGAGAKPAHFKPFTAAQHGGKMVRAICRLHHGQVRHEHVCSRDGRGT